MINQPSRLCPTAPALVVPGNPDGSFVIEKVTGDSPRCGDRMPLGMPALSATDVEALRAWIASLGDGGTVLIDAATDASSCPAGEAMCGGICIDVQANAAHCGACDRACGTGQSCAGGMCACAGGLTSCGTACVDMQSDAANCGACGNACGAATVCSRGSCIMGGCPGGTVSCSGSCVDTQTSSAHCGTCAMACPAGQACTAGACACTGGATSCGTSCVNTATDSRNCGTCGRICPPGSACVSGNCACSGGLTLCGSTCLDAQSDPMNCGTCGNICVAGSNCSNGACMSCGASVSFGTQVQAIFTRTCTTNCHSGPRPMGGLSLAAGSAFAQLVGAPSGCPDRRVRVTPRNVGASYLVNKLTGIGMCGGNRMPGGAAAPLSAGDMDLIRGWICNGAANN